MTMFKADKNGQRICIAIILVLSCLVISGCVSQTGKEERVYRIGVLSGLEFVYDITNGFKDGMENLGYIEGENVVYDVQRTDFDMENYTRILKRFEDEDVDLILVYPTEATIEAKKVADRGGIPVVFTFALIEEMGIVDSIREPGGYVTGVRYPGPAIANLRFEIMQELLPEADSMLIPYQKGYPIVEPQLKVLRPAAQEAGINLIELPAADVQELETELNKLLEDGTDIDAVLFLAEPLAVTPDAFAAIGKFSEDKGVPMGGALMIFGGYESIFGVNVNTYRTGEQASQLADKILRGTKAGTIAVVSSENYINVNYKEAQKQGIEVGEGLLAIADNIIR